MRLPRKSLRGQTLVEILVATTLLALVSGSVAMVIGTSMSTVNTESKRLEADFETWHGAQRTIDFFELAALSTFDPPLDPVLPIFTSKLRFSRLEDIVGGVVQWSDPIRIQMELEEGETDDGTDENGNGLIDENIVVVLFDEGNANEKRIVLARGIRELFEGEVLNGLDDNGNGLVDEPGFCFRLEGDSLHLFVTIEEIDSKGQSFVSHVETAMRIRNP